MAEQLVNGLVSPSATLATASITAGVTTAFDVTWNEPSPPSSGTYSLLFKGSATDGSDDSIFRVSTMSDSDSIATGSWEKVGNQSTFTSGCEIDLDHSKAALEGKLAEYAPLAGATFTGLITANAGITIGSGQLLTADGSLGSPAWSFGLDTDTGVRRVGANNSALVTGGADALSITTNLINAPAAGIRSASGATNGHQVRSSTYGMFSNSSGEMTFRVNASTLLSMAVVEISVRDGTGFTVEGPFSTGADIVTGTTALVHADASTTIIDPTTGAGETIDLPASSASGVIRRIVNRCANAVTISCSGGSIEGSTTVSANTVAIYTDDGTLAGNWVREVY